MKLKYKDIQNKLPRIISITYMFLSYIVILSCRIIFLGFMERDVFDANAYIFNIFRVLFVIIIPIILLLLQNKIKEKYYVVSAIIAVFLYVTLIILRLLCIPDGFSFISAVFICLFVFFYLSLIFIYLFVAASFLRNRTVRKIRALKTIYETTLGILRNFSTFFLLETIVATVNIGALGLLFYIDVHFEYFIVNYLIPNFFFFLLCTVIHYKIIKPIAVEEGYVTLQKTE